MNMRMIGGSPRKRREEAEVSVASSQAYTGFLRLHYKPLHVLNVGNCPAAMGNPQE